MTPISQVRDAAAAKVLERHPELKGLVTFDAIPFDLSPMVSGIYLKIQTVNNAAYTKVYELSKSVEHPEHWTKRDGPLAHILDGYCVIDNESFELDGYFWDLGDGDDSLALAEIDMSTVTLWVRTWWRN